MDINFFKNKKVELLERYVSALNYNDFILAKHIRIKLEFLDELIE